MIREGDYMNQDDVGELFSREGEKPYHKEAWRMVGYCADPTATFENLETKERVSGAVGSPLLRPFKRLKLEV